MKLYIKTNSNNEIYQAMKVAFDGAIEIETDISFNEIVGYSYVNNKVTHNLKSYKLEKIKQLETDFNAAKKITIQNGNTLEIAHDTPERAEFIQLIENISNLDTANNAVFIYKQQTDLGKLALRILPEIAAYIFKDLFITTLQSNTKVNSRVHNKTVTYELALEKINQAQSISDLDTITWSFLNPTGILIDVNAEAAKMLNAVNVSQFAKDAINAAKDLVTGEIHLVKTLQQLANDS